MKKKKIYVMLFAAAMSMLVGCGASMPDLTDEEYAMVAEYSAGLLMKYNRLNPNRLASDAEIARQLTAEEQFRRNTEEYIRLSKKKEEEEAASKNKNDNSSSESSSGSSEPVNVDIAEYIGISPITVTYKGVEVCDSYPQSSVEEFYFAMDATAGNKLVILKFDLYNPTGSDVQADVLGAGTAFYASFNGGGAVSILSTMLMNDFSTCNAVIPAGTSQEAVLVFELNEAVAWDASGGSIQLLMQNTNGVARNTLQ